ncbi:hypothetical protein HanPSC8_Chr14g0601581 [Helianthus annuus]|nr:hypothetical protein HanPSC8_Chr14g0601581 [Helianthus annuus]
MLLVLSRVWHSRGGMLKCKCWGWLLPTPPHGKLSRKWLRRNTAVAMTSISWKMSSTTSR